MREDSRRITSNRARTLGSIAVIAVLVCVSATGGTAAKVKAIKVNPITVDGNITDWAGVPTCRIRAIIRRITRRCGNCWAR